MSKIMIISQALLITAIIGLGTYHYFTVNSIVKEHQKELDEVHSKYTGIIERIEERNKDVIDIYKKREDNLISINEEQIKIMGDIGREEVIKQKPKLVEPKLNDAFRSIINEIAKETNSNISG